MLLFNIYKLKQVIEKYFVHIKININIPILSIVCIIQIDTDRTQRYNEQGFSI